MRKSILALVIAATTLSACSSSYNPMNWFGGSEEVVDDANANPLIPANRRGMLARPEDSYPGTPVGQVTDVKVERVPGGAVIRVTGVTDRLGAYAVKLLPQNEGEPVKGVLTYALLAIQPTDTPVGMGRDSAREVVVAHALTNQQLEGVRTIQVVAARNTRASRR